MPSVLPPSHDPAYFVRVCREYGQPHGVYGSDEGVLACSCDLVGGFDLVPILVSPPNRPSLSPEEADAILTLISLAQEVLVRAGIARPDEPDPALTKLREMAS